MGQFLGIAMTMSAEISKDDFKHDPDLEKEVLMRFKFHYPDNLFEYEDTKDSFRAKIREDLLHPKLTDFLSEVYDYFHQCYMRSDMDKSRYMHYNMSTLDSMSLDDMLDFAKNNACYDFQHIDKVGLIIKDDLEFYYRVDNLLLAMTSFKVYVDALEDLSIFYWLLQDKFAPSPFADLLKTIIVG